MATKPFVKRKPVKTTKYLLTTLLCLTFAFSSYAHYPNHGEENQRLSFRLSQPNGLGVCVQLTAMQGSGVFYDHNLNEDLQLHIQYNHGELEFTESDLVETDDFYEIQDIETILTRRMLWASLRYFFSRSWGWYIGAGLGYARSDLKYGSNIGSNFSASGGGIMGLAEVGWQGYDGYYFHIGVNPAAYLSYNDNYDDENSPKNRRLLGWRDADKYWRDSKILSSWTIGFGWFF